MTPNQTAVFEEFAKTIPGFITPSPEDNLTAQTSFANTRSIFEQSIHSSEVWNG